MNNFIKMKKISRREGLKAGLALTSSLGLMTLGSQTQAATNPIKTPFKVNPVYVPIADSQEMFPVRRIYCIGRNYEAHAKEMGSDPTREPPFFFQKPTDAIQYIAPNKIVDHPYPSLTKNYHHEVELVAALSKGGKNIPTETALEHVYGYALGIDMTRRDLQRMLGNEKKPWEIGKSFDHSAPIGPIFPVSKYGHITKGNISLTLNGQIKQQANLEQMIWSVAEQISKLSEANELFPGDIIYSGTPENVGPMVRGDVVVCKLDGLPDLSVKIV